MPESTPVVTVPPTPKVYEDHAKNTEAMEKARAIVIANPTKEDPNTAMSDKEINDMFRQDTFEELLEDFCRRRLHRIWKLIWGRKLAQIKAVVDDFQGDEPGMNDPRLLKVYLKERTRQQLNQQRGSIESVRKIKLVPADSGRTRFVTVNR